MGILSMARYFYRDYWNEYGDPRVVNFPLMGSGPFSTLLLVAVYLYISIYAGRKYMKNRPAFDLKRTIFVYNVCLASLNFYIFVNGLRLTNFGLRVLSCKKAESFVKSEEDLFYLYLGWLYFISKFIDFMDTFFFVLRKKDDHLSFLHLYHHSLMPIMGWLGLKFVVRDNTAFIPLINTFVHIFMYTYYALSTFSSLKPYLWFKSYITRLQLVQFVLIIIHTLYTMLNPACEYPKLAIYVSLANAFLFFKLFYSFFRSSYGSKSKTN